MVKVLKNENSKTSKQINFESDADSTGSNNDRN